MYAQEEEKKESKSQIIEKNKKIKERRPMMFKKISFDEKCSDPYCCVEIKDSDDLLNLFKSELNNSPREIKHLQRLSARKAFKNTHLIKKDEELENKIKEQQNLLKNSRDSLIQQKRLKNQHIHPQHPKQNKQGFNLINFSLFLISYF